MTATGTLIRNAVMVAASFFGRFGDLGRPDKIHKQRIGGTNKFKDLEDPFGAQEPEPEPIPLFWDLPLKHTFRQWHNYWRQFRRRVFIREGAGKAGTGRAHPGKKLSRLWKRERVAAMKAAGHYRGHNAPFVEGRVYV